jgi:glycosyltransferase involved in cell wall biosynthesis
MDKSDICVIIPTYNNGSTLADVIEQTLAQRLDIIVINDGSTDNTAELLKNYIPVLTLISYPGNKGKGFALKQGFAKACEMGFSYAVTLDSDGQHNPGNIPLFVEKLEEKLEETGDVVIIGNRNMSAGNAPVKSAFGKRFSNFWFFVETWKKCSDTQSGFRLYPLKPLMKKHFYTNRFEFEIESIVRLAWDNIPVKEIDIPVRYYPEGKRVSHFRPGVDFFRISVLNSILVLLAYCWYLPRLFFLKMRAKTWKELLLNPEESNLKKAKSLAFGVFMGIIPIWGFQMIVAFALAIIFKLNKALVLLASNISLPPMIPAIIFGSLWFGSLALRTGKIIEFSRDISMQSVGNMMLQYVIGSVILAAIASIATFFISYILLNILKKNETLTSKK